MSIFAQNSPFFCSWSGGKDSCLALYRTLREGGRPRFLLTMLTEGGERSRSHGLHITVIEKQARHSASPSLPVLQRGTIMRKNLSPHSGNLKKLELKSGCSVIST